LRPLWYTFLDRTRPPGATLDFSKAAFTLQVAVNLRVALKIVEPTPHCLFLADQVLARAKEYGDIRVLGAADPFSIAEAALDEALGLLIVEMKYCTSTSPKDRIVATVLVDKLTSGPMSSSAFLTEMSLYKTFRPKSDPA
jgi:hypothetical protein